MKSNPEAYAGLEDKDIFHKISPFFIWLLRDVALSLPRDCANIKEYFLTKVNFYPTEKQELIELSIVHGTEYLDSLISKSIFAEHQFTFLTHTTQNYAKRLPEILCSRSVRLLDLIETCKTNMLLTKLPQP